MGARLREIAERTAEIIERGRYTAPSGRTVELGERIARAVAGTTVHGPGPVVPGPPQARGAGGTGGAGPAGQGAPARAGTGTGGDGPGRAAAGGTDFAVTPEGSLAAASRMLGAAPEPVAVLNFASARNPGGGFLRGARAQEEYLCRNSALYASLRSTRGFYDVHRADPDPFYTDRVIHSPGVPVFRGEDDVLLEEPYAVGFLTSAAPNAGVIMQRMPGEAGRIPGAVRGRAGRVLQVAAAGGYRRLVLGAWGCGVFRCDPVVVAGVFRELLRPGGPFENRFAEVVFAVLDRPDSPARAAFADAFA